MTKLADSYEARKALAVAVAKVVIAGRELARLDISQDEAFAIVRELIPDLYDLEQYAECRGKRFREMIEEG